MEKKGEHMGMRLYFGIFALCSATLAIIVTTAARIVDGDLQLAWLMGHPGYTNAGINLFNGPIMSINTSDYQTV